jgi:hypothetical protein
MICPNSIKFSADYYYTKTDRIICAAFEGFDTKESRVLRKSIPTSAGEPSFFYLMMAEGCFRRAASTRHPYAGGMLRDIGRNYLLKANGVTSVLEAEQSCLAESHRLGY